MPKKKPKTGKPQVHKDLDGLEVTINEFGEIKSNFDVGKLNKFLDENVKDKKLKDRDDLDGVVRDEDWDPNAPAEDEEMIDEDGLGDMSDIDDVDNTDEK